MWVCPLTQAMTLGNRSSRSAPAGRARAGPLARRQRRVVHGADRVVAEQDEQLVPGALPDDLAGRIEVPAAARHELLLKPAELLPVEGAVGPAALVHRVHHDEPDGAAAEGVVRGAVGDILAGIAVPARTPGGVEVLLHDLRARQQPAVRVGSDLPGRAADQQGEHGRVVGQQSSRTAAGGRCPGPGR